MDLSDPGSWRWIWLIAMVLLGVGEMATAGSFFLAPFALGAAVAAVLAFASVALGVQWAAFLVISVAMVLAMRPLARRFEAKNQIDGIGANRQIGQRAQVIEAVGDASNPGMVLLGAEKWRAETDAGVTFEVGAAVKVAKVRGTRVVVTAAESDPSPAP